MKFKNIIKLTLIFIIIFTISMTSGYLLSKKVLYESNQKPKFNYQDNIDMPYIEKDNLSYKGDYISLGDDKLKFVLNFSFPEDVSSFEGVSIPELTIEDEKGKQVFIDTEDDRYHNSIADMQENSGIYINKNVIKELYIFKLKKKIDSKKIILTFKRVIVYNVNQGNPITKEFSGDWKLELNV